MLDLGQEPQRVIHPNNEFHNKFEVLEVLPREIMFRNSQREKTVGGSQPAGVVYWTN